MESLQTIALPAASILAGVSIWLFASIVSRLVNATRVRSDGFEESRRVQLRSASGTYRHFEPLVDEISGFFPPSYASDELQHHLKLSVDEPPWLPSEFMATKAIEGVLVFLGIVVFLLPFGLPALALMLGIGTGLFYPTLARKSVITRAKRRLRQIKIRLPFTVDQISLMMEAGAGFEDSLKTVVADNPRHPLSKEFSEVVRQMSLGRPRSQALTGFRDRLADDDISEIVFAIIKGEELGTPLSSILREQANQMRLKRSQWGEKAAAEAEVQMVFPGMITMIACLLVIVAPIMLPLIVKFIES